MTIEELEQEALEEPVVNDYGFMHEVRGCECARAANAMDREFADTFEYSPGHLVPVVNEEGTVEYMFLTEDGRMVPVEDC